MSDHARLSPSSAERWLHCPASVELSESYSDESSPYAEEGTRAHTVAEAHAAALFGLPVPVLPEADEDMYRHGAQYAEHLNEFMVTDDEKAPGFVRLEQRVYPGVPECYGTADAVIVKPRTIRIVDYKYGAGVKVYAVENPQLMLYGLGALEMFGDVLGVTEQVHITVHQPRMDHLDTWTISAQELREWRDYVVVPGAALTRSPEAHFAPSLSACRWCPASGDCKARTEYLTKRDFGDPGTLSVEDLAEALRVAPQMRDWLKNVEERALSRAYGEGETIPGFKVVQSGGKRSIPDADEAIERFRFAGYSWDEVTRVSTKTLGDLEKLVKDRGETLEDVLGDALKGAEGKPSLVPEDDERPAINAATQAAKDFTD